MQTATMYQQSNTSAPAFDGTAGVTSRGPPLADELGYAFDKMSVAEPAAGGAGSTQAAANAEIYQSAREVHPANSLAAIAHEVDATAADLRAGAAAVSENGSRRPSGASGVDPAGVYTQQAAYQQHQQPGAYIHQQALHPQSTGNGGGGYDAAGYPISGGGQQGWAASEAGYYPTPAAGTPQDDFYGAPQQQQQQQYVNHQQHGSFYGAGASASGSAYAPAGYDAQGAAYYAPQPGAYQQDYQGYAGFAQQQGPPSSGGGHHMGGYPSGLTPSMGLARQPTQLSMASAASGSSAAANARRRSKEIAAAQQTLPFNKSFVDEYRQRMKGDPDAEAQFAFAKYLIEAAKKVSDPKDGPKQARKYRDALLGESLKLVKRLATTGMGLGKPPYADAQFFLANCFGAGSLGLQVDHEKAYNLYVQASKQNHAAATYRTAVCNEVGAGTRRDHHRAVLFYRKASALGDTAGMYKLGMILLNGLLGQPRNVREAIVWLKRAAGQADEDNPHALHELGLLHERTGSSVVLHDEAYARELFTNAAQLGYAPSQFKLGSAYEYGSLTCPVDPRRSIAWYTKAAGKNDGESELALSGWYLTGSEGVLKQSDSEAYLWARRAATKGIPKAEYAVGYYSEVGIGVKADIDEAKRWYMRAAAQGNKRAMQRLTELKKMGGKTGKKGARPTRKDAEGECSIM